MASGSIPQSAAPPSMPSNHVAIDEEQATRLGGIYLSVSIALGFACWFLVCLAVLNVAH